MAAMSAIDSLRAAVTATANSVASLTAAVEAAIPNIGSGTASEADIQAQTEAINALSSAIDILTSRLLTATGSAAAPPPTP